MNHPDTGIRHHDEPILLGYQRAWVADQSPVKVCQKGRRIGLSWAEASDDCLLAAASEDAGGMDVWYISYNKTMTETFVKDVAWWAKIFNKAAGEVEEFVFRDGKDNEISAFRITFDSGYRVTGLSSAPRSLRSIQGKIVIDEAAFVESLAELLKAAIAMLVWGGRLVVISTHDGDDNPFNELCQEILAGKRPYSMHKYTLDDALADGLFKRICTIKQNRERDPEKRAALKWSPEREAGWRGEMVEFYGEDADEELFCIPARGGGAYFPYSLIEAAMRAEIPVLFWSPPFPGFVDRPDDERHREVLGWLDAKVRPHLGRIPGRRHFFGEDFARHQDLTAMWPLAELQDLSHEPPFVLELRDCPFTQQEQVLFYILGGLPRFSGAAMDAGGNGAYLAERARQKFGGPDMVHEISLTSAWYDANFPPLKAAFEDRSFSIPKDSFVRDDFRAVKRVRGVPMVPRGEKDASRDKGKRHGDTALAGVLALYAARTICVDGEWSAAIPQAGRPGSSRAAQMVRGYRS